MNRARAALIAASVAWGVAASISDAALVHLSATQLLVVELAVGAVVLWAAVLVRGRRGRRPGLALVIGLGVLEPGLTYLLANLGLARESAATASLLLSLETAFAVLGAIVVLGERLPPAARPVLITSLIGAALVGLSGEPGRDTATGTVLIIGASLTAAAYAIAARRLLTDDLDVVLAAAWQVTTGLLLALTALLADGAGAPWDAPVGPLALGALAGVTGTAIPFVLFTHAATRVPAALTALILSAIPLVGLLTAIAIRGDHPGPLQLSGAALLIGGLGWLARST